MALAHSAVFSFNKSGKTTIGFVLPISAKTGIGSGRELARSKRALPPVWLPVNPTAFTRLSITNFSATPKPSSKRWLNVPSGKSAISIAFRMHCATSSLVPGWYGCAFTITGQPAARAEMESVPAVEYARGKLLAPKTRTGPIPTFIFRRSGVINDLFCGASIDGSLQLLDSANSIN